MEKIFELLGWTNGQICRFWDWIDLFKNFSFSGFSLKRFFAGILAAFELFNAAAFKTPVHPYGQELDLSDYQLVFSDEFDGDALNTDVWYTRDNDIFHEYNTYGLEWTDDEYIFYINGIETGRTSFGNGVSTDMEELIVSLEISEAEITLDKSEKTEFIVDYVKVWQK